MRDRYIGLIILLTAGLLYYWSYGQIVDVGTTMKGVNSPRFFPRLTLICMAFFAIVLIYQDLVGRGTKSNGKEVLISREMVILFSIAGGFVLSLRTLGYFISAPLLLFCTMLYLGERNWIRIILITLITPAVLYLFFDRILEILLPWGTLLERFAGP